ncbi:hypothetical protein LTSERUB_3211 [Salmonella enterica subsp. enterica serovar Rubislaw str. A4-653]|uniref:Uncharacterized protein n=1 Tax=Salmonella enterica subsp. enterica serovar Rubislaw str. A4-653 TaxID=913081 RepID=G5QKJ8_SALRU|nr:hypothetical protein LTSERUB_3211 [Salmonella enterica subsp. enterica serovar Rubislaw str. A4-653]
MKQNYLRAETLVSANARLVDFQSTLELAGGEVASADLLVAKWRQLRQLTACALSRR